MTENNIALSLLNKEPFPYIIRQAQASDIDDSAQCHFETWSTCYKDIVSSKYLIFQYTPFSFLIFPRGLEYPVLYPKLLKSRQEIIEATAKGTGISMIAEWSSPTLPAPKSISDPSKPLRLLGHCDIGLPDDYSPFLLTVHPSSPTLTIQDNTANTLEIYSLYVHPAMQHTGCAQRLFACAARAGLRKFTHSQRMIGMYTAFNTQIIDK